MGARGVLKTAAKVIAFLAFIAVAVFLFRKDSTKSLSDRLAMHKCPDLVLADVALLLAVVEPKVVRCEGSPTAATCFIQTTEETGRKTAPVKDWDCTKRHLSAEWVDDLAGLDTAMATDEAKRRDMIVKALKVQQDMAEGFQYVRSRLKERSELLEGE